MKINVKSLYSAVSVLIICAGVLLLCFLPLFGCSPRYEYAEGMVWSTSYHITYKGSSSLKDSVRVVLDRVGTALSVFDETSEVSRVNANVSTPVGADFIKVYTTSKRVSEESGGVFDPTLSPIITAWGFGKGHKCTADTARIDSLLAIVGIDKTRLSGRQLVKDDVRIQFNFSAIAKGYGCDAVGEMFRRNGVTDYLVEIGGEIAASGRSSHGGKWRVSIDRPVVAADREVHDSQAVIEISEGGVATSGDYRNYHEINGKRVGHTIDRFTGRPALTDVASATVIAADCMEADAYATTCMALGMNRAMELAGRLHLAVMLVGHHGEVWCSPRFSSYMVRKD